MKKHLFVIVLTVLGAVLQVNAKPAKPGLMTRTLSDGTTLNVRLVGDEFFHQYFSEDWYPLMEVDGDFYYCNVNEAGERVNSGIKAVAAAERAATARQFLQTIDKEAVGKRLEKMSAESPRRASMVSDLKADRQNAPQREEGVDGPPYERGYGLFSDIRFPAYGFQKAIVILVEYTDVKFTLSDPYDYFNRMLNEEGFNDYGGTGCAAEYHRLNSMGAFDPQFDVYGPITLAHNQAYYGGNNWWGDDQNPGEMVKEACDYLDPTVDFTEYDRDGNGIVDNVFIFYAGMGEASGGSANTVWPHSWNMTSAGFPNLYYDGVKVHTYGCSNEWESGRPDGVGTFIHEFSHVMGIPDIYATSYTGAFTPGAWSAMDYGPYNNQGMTPPNYGAYERYALGWMKPREIDRVIDGILPSIDSNIAGVIRTSSDKEFFLVENRQKEGWDKYVPGHGMLIWHIDYNQSVFDSNKVNNTPSHQYVDIEEADGTQSEGSRSGDSFPGTANKTSFTSTTNPAMKTWSGQSVNFPITDIAESSDGIISFKVLGGGADPIEPTTASEASEVSCDGFTANWNSLEGKMHILSVFTLKQGANAGQKAIAESDREYLPGYKNRILGEVSSHTVTGLEPLTTYYYTVAVSDGWATSEHSEEVAVTTTKASLDRMELQALDPSDISYNGFTANWTLLEDATDYIVTVEQRDSGIGEVVVCDFTGGFPDCLPAGWSTTTQNTYGMQSYSGESAPSLRLLRKNDGITTAKYDDDIKTLSFWCRGQSLSDGDCMRVSIAGEDGAWTVYKEEPIATEAGGRLVEYTEMPEDCKQVKIEFGRQAGAAGGSVALDDVKVGHGVGYVYLPVDEYTEVPAGNVNSFAVTGLLPETDYVYKVQGTDGNLFSKPSILVPVTTLALPVGVEGITDTPQSRIMISGRTISVTGGEWFTVCDFAGRVIASGRGSVTLPNGGLYIINVPSSKKTQKTIIK